MDYGDMMSFSLLNTVVALRALLADGIDETSGGDPRARRRILSGGGEASHRNTERAR